MNNSVRKEHFQYICRFCLCEGVLYNIFDISYEEIQLSSILNQLFYTEIDPNDEFPKKMCANCTAEAIRLHIFKNQCQESEKALRIALDSGKIRCEYTIVEDRKNLDGIESYRIEFDNSTVESEGILASNNQIIAQNKLEGEDVKRVSPTCKMCNSQLIRKQMLKNQSVHVKKKLYQCVVCSKNFVFRKSFHIHVKAHIGKKAYTCCICEKSFPRKRGPKIVAKKLKNYSSAGGLCPLCGKKYKFFRQHLRTHYAKKSLCVICGKLCFCLRLHLQRHTAERNYLCHICSKTFFSRSLLTRHMRVHTGEKRHTCQICGRMFGYDHHLKRHLLIHTGERPYECSNCNKTFRFSEDLKKHLNRKSHQRKRSEGVLDDK